MSQDAPELSWAVEMPLLTNRFFLYDMLKLFFWVAVLLGVLLTVTFAFGGSLKNLPPILKMFALILGGIFFLFVLISWIFFGNRFPMRFRINSWGVGWSSLSRRSRLANRAAVIAGVASGSLAGTGAGLLAISQESGQLAWEKVQTVKKYPAECVITLMNSWRVVIRLFCTPENYADVARLVDACSARNRAGAAAK